LVGQAKQSIPVGSGEYAARVQGVRERMDQLEERLATVSERQDRYLQSLAIEALEGQKRRIETYQIQARYALATIYDRAVNDKQKAAP
jgi:hypothetical protein